MNLLNSLKTLTLALILSIGIGYAYAAWAPPTNPPTGGNAEAPVNVGSATQLKAGGLAVNGLLYVVSKLGIGDSSPDATLILDVEGSVGATQYCDKDGNNCITNTGGGIRFPDNTTQVTAFTGSGASPSCVVQYVGACTGGQPGNVDMALPGYTDRQCEWIGTPGYIADGACAYCGHPYVSGSAEYAQQRDLENRGCATLVSNAYIRCCNYNIQ